MKSEDRERERERERERMLSLGEQQIWAFDFAQLKINRSVCTLCIIPRNYLSESFD